LRAINLDPRPPNAPVKAPHDQQINAMSQRISGYVRQANDSYQTPSWVTDALVPHVRSLALHIWEPAAGSGKMVDALSNAGFRVVATDITTGVDFLKCDALPSDAIQAVVTNPPFSDAQEFIEHALDLTRPVGGVVAMLARVDYDSAKTRRHLFGECPAFATRLVLTKRIKWFADSKGSPSFNHCWFLWDWQHTGKPTIDYAP
jgi:hypothetical protein